MKNEFDVVIIGGGPAGAAAAITLCRYTKLSVAIVERANFDDYRAGESVSPSVFSLLNYLGLEREELDQAHLAAYSHAAAWGSDELVVRDLLFTGQGHGMHLDRQKFDTLLLETAVKFGAQLFQPYRINEVQKDDDWTLSISNEEAEHQLKAKFAIDCSGKNALIVKKQRCLVHKEDNLIALYAYYRMGDHVSVPHQTVLETTEHGWYYLTPLPGNKLVIAFMTDADILKSENLNDPADWLKHGLATQHVSPILSKLGDPERMQHYAIHSRVAALPYGVNWTAAGDAVASFDPISSLGIGHALNSGINSARVVESYFNGDDSVGKAYSHNALEHFGTYLQMRKGFYNAEQRWLNAPFWQRRMVT
jgi:flavin-dependent dehydrogenase